MPEKEADDLLEALELRAMERAADEAEAGGDAGAELSLVDAFSGEVADADATAARDVTLAGYIAVHNRVPAFEGSDGQPYTVDVDAEESGDAERPWGAFLVFLRWAETGAGIMDHVTSGDVAHGATEAEARERALDLSLYEVKAELDAAIERRRRDLEA